MPCRSTIDDRIQFFCFVLYYFGACPSGRPPGPEMEYCTDRESYSLAAGLALGMVCLGVSHTDRNIPLIDMSHEKVKAVSVFSHQNTSHRQLLLTLRQRLFHHIFLLLEPVLFLLLPLSYCCLLSPISLLAAWK